MKSTVVFVYGSTPGGIAAALESAKNGAQTILACPKKHVGGMTASGLCTTDAVRRNLFGGIVNEFVSRVRAWYRKNLGPDSPDYRFCSDGWHYEPSVAEQCFEEMLAAESDRLAVMKGWILKSVTCSGRIVKMVRLENDRGEQVELEARVFIDATYEGDLAAAAGVDYRVGRESREEYGESLAGIHYMNWKTGKEIPCSCSGEASSAIQAYCARSIITDDPAHLVKISRPDSYEEHLPDFLPLLMDFECGRVKSFDDIVPYRPIPNRKIQVNGNIEALTSINCPGMSWEYPEAGPELRKELDRFHVEHVAGLMYFLQTDRHVPEEISRAARRFGLHDREFPDNGHWPWQIYVRQGRRIRGRKTITQHNFIVDPKTGRTPDVEFPIALGEHSFDIHPCHDRRFARNGFAEGVLWYPAKTEGPAQPGCIPYGALLTRNLDNLLVPVAISSTHIAMSVLRMEPVWMTTGQIAGFAAAEACAKHMCPDALDPNEFPLIPAIANRKSR